MKPFYPILLISCFVALSASNSRSAYSQSVPDDITYYALTDRIKAMKRSCLSIEKLSQQDYIAKANPTRLGSGFLVNKAGSDYAVTCLHVTEGLGSNDLLLVGVNLKEGKVYVIPTISRVDATNDVAILQLTNNRFFTKFPVDTTRFSLDQAFVGVSAFADSTDFDEGVGVLLIGFPLGLGVEVVGNQPVSRIGIIAQSLRYDGTFLVDGIASHGNSGSPIFSVRTGRLLGMVTGFPSDFISAFDENGKLIARLPYNSGLSVCISSERILDIIP